MAITAHAYQIYLAATPAQVWTAITDPEWTRQYFHGTSFVTPPAAGERYLALKTLLESRQGVEANNTAFELLAADRDDAGDEDLVRTAYTAAYHWQRAAGAGPENESRASYLISRALQVTGDPQAALRAADRSLAVCTAHGLVDFDLAYAHEARARALRALGRHDEARAAWAAAVAVPIADADDEEILRADFAVDPVG